MFLVQATEMIHFVYLGSHLNVKAVMQWSGRTKGLVRVAAMGKTNTLYLNSFLIL